MSISRLFSATTLRWPATEPRPFVLRHSPLAWLAVGCVTALLATSAQASTPSAAVVTDSGQILRAVDGSYAELFPNDGAVPDAIRVLALDIEDASGHQRLLVPTSETWRPERSPAVIWDSASSTSILLWLSGTGAPGHYTIEFVNRTGDTWGPVNNGRYGNGGPVIFDSEPEIFVSSDQLDFATGENTLVTVSRQVVHLVWREAATENLLYMPLVFLDGTYVGRSDVVTLSHVLFKANEGTETTPGMSEPLRHLFAVEQKGSTLLLAVSDADHNHLGVVAVELLPISLAALADHVLGQVLGFGGQLDEGGMQSLSDGIRAQIISVGYTLQINPAVTEYTAARVAEWLRLGDPALGLEALATGARDRTLDVSSSVIAQTVVDPSTAQGQITELDLGEFLSSDDEEDHLSDLVRLGVRLDVAAPSIDAPDLQALIGGKGTQLILAWTVESGAGLRYVEYRSRDSSWSEPQTLPLSANFDLEHGLSLLRRRMN